jgi:putative Mg2+ transporter-C (MgtC) family protein
MESSIGAGEVIVRVLLALVPAAVIGVEREIGQQPAGLRTHVLVSLGACLFTIAGIGFANSDPTRVAAQVATGIGFLGAGAIIRERFRVKGLTTAASLWVTAAIGMAAGLGAYAAAGITAAIALLVLLPLKWVEREIFPERPTFTFAVTVDPGVTLGETVERVASVLGEIVVRRVEPTPAGGHVLYGERYRAGGEIVERTEQLRALPGIGSVDLQQT